MNKTNQTTALLVMDMQSAVIRRLPDYNDIIENVSNAIKHARLLNLPVIYVIVNFRSGMPEVSMNNKMFSGTKERASQITVDMSEAMKIDASIAPLEHDIVITKRRLSAFTGSDFEVVLRSMGMQHIILTGVATSGVVLSTLREAADKDYIITVISDCCTDAETDVHQLLITKVFPKQAAVISLAEWKNEQGEG